MISLKAGRHDAPRARSDATWESVAVAVALTWAAMAGISLPWRPDCPTAQTNLNPARDEVMLVTLPSPHIALAPEHQRAPSSARASQRSARALETGAAPRDTGLTSATAQTTPQMTAPLAVIIETPMTSAPMAPSMSTRLLPSRLPSTPRYSAPRSRNPFLHGEEVTGAERDSMLSALGPQIPQLAAERIPTRSEIDARAKEAMLKMRLTGRILLVPPDNSGGLITASIPLPFLDGSQSRALARRDRSAASAGQAIQERLRLRADSVRRAKADSLARHVGGPN
ncbi:MAG: hypothetical protein M3Z05_00875 [Gemmatimonadota bacterium]|nr:hypothetical protein [Gemmatimonadota bacterium]